MKWNNVTKAALIVWSVTAQVWADDVKPVWISQPMYGMGHRQPQCTPPVQRILANYCRFEDEAMQDFIDYLNQAIPRCHFSNPHLVGSYQRHFLLSHPDSTGYLQASAAEEAGDIGVISFTGTRAVTFDCHCQGEQYPLERLRITKYRRYGCPQGFVAKKGYNHNQVGLRDSDRDLGQPIQWPYLCTPAPHQR